MSFVIDVQEPFRHRPCFTEHGLPAYLAAQKTLIAGGQARTATVLRGRFATLCSVEEALAYCGDGPVHDRTRTDAARLTYAAGCHPGLRWDRDAGSGGLRSLHHSQSHAPTPTPRRAAPLPCNAWPAIQRPCASVPACRYRRTPTFRTLLPPDVLMVPGGVVEAAAACPATRAWVAQAARHAQVTASGVHRRSSWRRLAYDRWSRHHALGRPGRPAHAVSTPGRAGQCALGGPGSLVTSAGISAGIDMSLHLVARLAGVPLAERTARQMDTPDLAPVTPHPSTWSSPCCPAAWCSTGPAGRGAAHRQPGAAGAGPARTLRAALCQPHPEAATSVGVALAGLAPLPAQLPVPAWVVLVGMPGSTIGVESHETRTLLHWLRGLRPTRGRLELVTVCAGAVLAAHAGLLAGRRAAPPAPGRTDPGGPRCDVVANRVFVADGPVHSSAGVTTGIDLLLTALPTPAGRPWRPRWRRPWWSPCVGVPDDPEFSPFCTTATTCTPRCTACRMPWPSSPRPTGAFQPWPPVAPPRPGT